MENTREYLARVKLIRENLETHLLYQRNLNAAYFPHNSIEAAHAEARLDGLRETITMVVRLQLDIERELARDIT